MQLSIHKDDADILLVQKNVINDLVLEKYQVAGQITQGGFKFLINLINDSYHTKKLERPYSIQELCILSDSYLSLSLSSVYKSKINEKGISHPTCISVNDLYSNISPEVDDGCHFLKSGDFVSITMGVHIDGYVALMTHSLFIFPSEMILYDSLKPRCPIINDKADSACAAWIAVETVVKLLALVICPEKMPETLKKLDSTNITGKHIRALVDGIAESYKCIVAPGSKVRRIRRFLSGQSEGIVHEKEYKGVYWNESNQEKTLIYKHQPDFDILNFDSISDNRLKLDDDHNIIPKDDFIVLPGEVYHIDIKMVSLKQQEQPGIVTADEDYVFDKISEDKNTSFKSGIYVRDLVVNKSLKLKSARKLLSEIDRNCSVFPFKLSYLSSHFPLDLKSNVFSQIDLIKKSILQMKFGLIELINNYVLKTKRISSTKHIPLQTILHEPNLTGINGLDTEKLLLPGKGIILPYLGISSLKMKYLSKKGSRVTSLAYGTTVIINTPDSLLNPDSNFHVFRLTGNKNLFNPIWSQSSYSLLGEYADSILELEELSSIKRFGLKIKECSLFDLEKLISATPLNSVNMQLD